MPGGNTLAGPGGPDGPDANVSSAKQRTRKRYTCTSLYATAGRNTASHKQPITWRDIYKFTPFGGLPLRLRPHQFTSRGTSRLPCSRSPFLCRQAQISWPPHVSSRRTSTVPSPRIIVPHRFSSPRLHQPGDAAHSTRASPQSWSTPHVQHVGRPAVVRRHTPRSRSYPRLL